MASIVRVRVRAGPKPVSTSDYSNEDDFVPDMDQTTEQVEEIVESEEVNPFTEVDKILDCEMRPTASDNPESDNQVLVKQYLVKWKGLSYLHCSWVSEEEFQKACKSNRHLKARVNRFNSKMKPDGIDGDDFVAIRHEWITVDRIIACRDANGGKEYLVKYKELSYEESYWESESDISAFYNEIQKFNNRNSGSRRDMYVKNKRNHKEFKQFDQTPEFLTGILHSYQLVGLSFMRYSLSQQRNVILADEMGLGKTIQSIGLLASLFEENVAPHLVIAPLSTLRNWEREFATWAPQMNVVTYIGTSKARRVIREHEFSIGHEIKFDVLLTSYEMINKDTAVLKPIKWNCMIVDEGHRLKNRESKLYSSLQQYTSKHRVLLTGTPLQNNLDELFTLMHFLDAEKFGSLEEFQEEFKDINKEEQISRLHKLLAPHLLRSINENSDRRYGVKKDVLKDMLPPKKELILRVDLSSQQKKFYKAIITGNYHILAKRRDAKISNVLMELRKVCLHSYMLKGVEPNFEDADEAFKQLVEVSGKLQLLDKMMVKLNEQGRRVLIYSQFCQMLNILEDYCITKKWFYERIDGKVSGAERQVRIDRFNAENSNRFCFLLSTRAGGLGINLATADTVIIYDSDWNPHADLQAMARAHRLGQINKVMVYRLLNRGTVEERMMQMAKKKLLLEHLVVEQLKGPNLTQEELNDIIKYGSKELFSEENEEAGKYGKIHYDDDAIEKLLDRDHVDTEEVSLDDDQEENEFLKAFKVASFEYIDENEASALEDAQKAAAASEEAQAIENMSSASNADRKTYWEELLIDKHEVHQAEELNALGKRKRNCKKMTYVEEDEDDDLSGLEKTSSDESDEAEPTVVKAARQGNPRGRRKPYRKRARRDNSEPIPLMEGKGESLRVLGFNYEERKTFYKTFMRYGPRNYDWKEFVHLLKRKTCDEINKYGILFLEHINAKDSEIKSPNFQDGVPKEGIDSEKVLVRMAFLMRVEEKCKFLDEHPTKPVFPDHIVIRFGLRNGVLSSDEHDRMLIRAVYKHGYGKWLAIVDDKEFGIEELLCKKMNIPFPYIGLSAAELAGLQESSLNQETGNAGSKNASTGGRQKKYLQSYERIHDKLGDRVRRRCKILEEAIKYEYAEKLGAQQAEAETEVMETVGASFVAVDKEMLDQLPQTEPITSEESSAAVVDNKQGRVEATQLYNQMCISVNEKSRESVQSYVNRQPLSQMLRESSGPVEPISEEISRSLDDGTEHNVEMKDSAQEPTTSRSSGLVAPSIMEEEEKDDIQMDAADNVIVLD